MKKILFLVLVLLSFQAFAFPFPFNNGIYGYNIYYCPDDNVNDGWCNPLTEWGCSSQLVTPSHPYDGTACIIAPAPVSCALPNVRDNNVLSATYNTCIAPPVDYSCNSPKEWVFTAESSWKCVSVSGLSGCGTAPYSATKAGVCVSGGIYHTTGFFKNLICDPANTYECKPPNSDCNFWTSIIDSTCTN